MAHRLPNWDNEENNSLKKNLYQHLNDFWKLAIRTTATNLRQGECYSPDSVGEWAKSLAQHNSFTNGFYFTESVHEFTKQLGYMIGLQPTVTESEMNNSNIISSSNNSNNMIDATTPICHITPLETSLTFSSIVGDRR
jgi:hypothetical protein